MHPEPDGSAFRTQRWRAAWPAILVSKYQVPGTRYRTSSRTCVRSLRYGYQAIGFAVHPLEHEPPRIREFYRVRATRVEPVGLVYLWPETN